ncbi:hypothetical protein [Nocardia sp. NPDC024068]|uniref:hypothetical protein n=1 Tax=Nocardia sp. NPDC024068 TaxID=3157197 RepID=UPI0033D1791E
MRIRFGSAPAADHRDAARVRGAVAGLISGTVSVAAHGWAAPAAVPDSTAIMLLAAASAALGALVAGLRPLRTGIAGLPAVLAAGQLLGHICLGWGSGHLHHGDLQLTPGMIAAHILVACVAALIVRGAEAAYRSAAAALARLLPILIRPPVVTGPRLLRRTYRARVVPRILVLGAVGTRGPPRTVLI